MKALYKCSPYYHGASTVLFLKGKTLAIMLKMP